jgi:hypothetical protein
MTGPIWASVRRLRLIAGQKAIKNNRDPCDLVGLPGHLDPVEGCEGGSGACPAGGSTSDDMSQPRCDVPSRSA